MKMSDLFELNIVHPSYRGYFVDKELNLYSTRSGQLTRLVGFSRPSLYIGGKNKSTMLVKTQILRNSEFQKFMKLSVPRQEISVDTSSNSVAKGVFVIAVVRDNVPLFSKNPVLHKTEDSAITEIKRLVSENPGEMFAYFECKGLAKYSGVTWL